MPGAGEICIRCGATVRSWQVDDASNADGPPHEARTVYFCGCDDGQGPVTQSDLDNAKES